MTLLWNSYNPNKLTLKLKQVEINGFDITVGSNYTLMSATPNYGARLGVSNKF